MAKRKILIIDDERGFSEMVKLTLECSERYEVKIENDPENALSAALHYEPDLILLDVIMGDKEGPDVAIEIKENAFLKDTPVVFLTATVTAQEVKRQRGRIGGHEFVAKPSTLDILIASIERNLLAI